MALLKPHAQGIVTVLVHFVVHSPVWHFSSQVWRPHFSFFPQVCVHVGIGSAQEVRAGHFAISVAPQAHVVTTDGRNLHGGQEGRSAESEGWPSRVRDNQDANIHLLSHLWLPQARGCAQISSHAKLRGSSAPLETSIIDSVPQASCFAYKLVKQ